MISALHWKKRKLKGDEVLIWAVYPSNYTTQILLQYTDTCLSVNQTLILENLIVNGLGNDHSGWNQLNTWNVNFLRLRQWNQLAYMKSPHLTGNDWP
jgi:hypothetical protein